jgi:hypothetical protein
MVADEVSPLTSCTPRFVKATPTKTSSGRYDTLAENCCGGGAWSEEEFWKTSCWVETFRKDGASLQALEHSSTHARPTLGSKAVRPERACIFPVL